jgi:glutathione S-transferase
MSTTLYGSTSTAALVVHWLLIELGIEHELVLLDFDAREHKSAEYLALNPAGVVPTLLIDGLVLTEAAAIALSWPTAIRTPACCRHWARRSAPMPTAGCSGVPIRCSRPIAPGSIRTRWRARQTWRPVARWRDSAWKRPGSMWPHLLAHGPYLLGATPCVVDYMLVMLMRWSRNMPRPSDTWPSLKAHATSMKARPAFAEAYRREGITDWR